MTQLRLIATDLDGTLLEPDGSMPEGIFNVIRELDTLGIRFVAASGRQYGNLRRLFAPVSELMGYVCENGAVNAVGGEVIGTVTIPRDMGLQIIHDIEEAQMCVLVSGRHTCYLKADNRAYADNIVYRLRNTVTIVDDFDIIPEPYLKLSGYNEKGVANLAPMLLKKWSDKVNAAVAGRDWFDFTISDKGVGLSMLMKTYSITPDEVAAFGDNFNDESMLDAVGHPFLMMQANRTLYKPGYTLCEKVLPLLKAIVKANGRLS